jgi:hypothetical protein
VALILAIEPDRRQTSKLAALAKHTLHAELVAGDSTERAVAALDGRVPDLILTSMLLSPKDETALADWLRELDDAGSHVQTLVIPVLGNSPRRSGPGGGILNRLTGKGGSESAPDGCDPDVFANQIREYLDRVAEERRLAAEDLEVIDLEAPPKSMAVGTAKAADEAWEEIELEVKVPENVELTAEAIDLDKFVAELNTHGQEGRDRRTGQVRLEGSEGQEGKARKSAPPAPAHPVPPAQKSSSAATKKDHDPVEEFAAALGAISGDDARPDASRKQRPAAPAVRDDWSGFDPKRCGFPALIAKLERLEQKNR